MEQKANQAPRKLRKAIDKLARCVDLAEWQVEFVGDENLTMKLLRNIKRVAGEGISITVNVDINRRQQGTVYFYVPDNQGLPFFARVASFTSVKGLRAELQDARDFFVKQLGESMGNLFPLIRS